MIVEWLKCWFFSNNIDVIYIINNVHIYVYIVNKRSNSLEKKNAEKSSGRRSKGREPWSRKRGITRAWSLNGDNV